jgi:hypothetical protein
MNVQKNNKNFLSNTPKVGFFQKCQKNIPYLRRQNKLFKNNEEKNQFNYRMSVMPVVSGGGAAGGAVVSGHLENYVWMAGTLPAVRL